jgi:hypothetical protein
MLHRSIEIIDPRTFELIQELQRKSELEGFNLVGGTALALQLGHRNSIDIDLFCNNEFTDYEILSFLNSNFNVNVIFNKPNTIICLIDNIKTDFIKHDYPIIDEIIEEDGIKMLGMKDIAAMKVHAIIQSGQRLKDFIDIYFLLEHFSMNEIMDFFTIKYEYMNPVMALKAITYFDEIDENIDPPKLLKPLSIKSIQKRITKAALDRNLKF